MRNYGPALVSWSAPARRSLARPSLTMHTINAAVHNERRIRCRYFVLKRIGGHHPEFSQDFICSSCSNAGIQRPENVGERRGWYRGSSAGCSTRGLCGCVAVLAVDYRFAFRFPAVNVYTLALNSRIFSEPKKRTGTGLGEAPINVKLNFHFVFRFQF